MARPVETSPTWGSRLVGVEGLRAIAAISVLVFHVAETPHASLGGIDAVLPSLREGLTLFFTLSGFLLYRPFAAAILGSRSWPSVGAYLRNRALRILPAYWVVLILVGLVIGVATIAPGTNAAPTPNGYLGAGTFFMDFFLIENLDPHTLVTGIGPAWTLSVEVVFYLALPALGLLALRVSRGGSQSERIRAAMLPALILLAIGIVGKVWEGPQPADGAAAYASLWGETWHAVLARSFLAQADLFAFGMAAAVLVVLAENGVGGSLLRERGRRYAGITALAGAAILIAASAKGVIGDRVFDTLMAIVCALLVLWVTLPGRERRGSPVRVLETREAVWIGVISYSIYLWHYPLIDWLYGHGVWLNGRLGLLVDIGLVVAITLALATLTYRFVEAPALRRKARMTPTRDSQGNLRSPEPAAIEAAP